MKDLGKLHYFFNIKVIKYPKRRRLLYMQYALNELSKYGMTCCKHISISLELNVKLNANAS